jgi:multiple sugar transport system permease protein
VIGRSVDQGRLSAAVGGLLVGGAALVEIAQVARPFGFPFYGWVIGTLAGLGLLWHGLNRLRQDLGARVVAGLIAIGIVLLIVVPFGIVVVFGAFQTRADLLSGPHVLSPRPSSIAFDQLMRIPYFETGLRNSLLVSTSAAVVTTLLGLLGAYAIARLRFPGRSAMYTAVMIAYMLPGVALLVPLVAIFKGLGLIDTLPGMAIGHIALTVPLVTWILIGTFDAVEPDLEHAARIDGASRLQALRRVVLPVTVPSIVTAAVFGFVLSWNDLLVSKVLYIGGTPMLAPSIVNLMDPINRIEPQLSMAGLIASVPVLGLALVMQRYLIRGLGEGAVK